MGGKVGVQRIIQWTKSLIIILYRLSTLILYRQILYNFVSEMFIKLEMKLRCWIVIFLVVCCWVNLFPLFISTQLNSIQLLIPAHSLNFVFPFSVCCNPFIYKNLTTTAATRLNELSLLLFRHKGNIKKILRYVQGLLFRTLIVFLCVRVCNHE